MESYSWIKYSHWITAETNIIPSKGKEEENNEDFTGINGIINMRIKYYLYSLRRFQWCFIYKKK